jgi:hypothetical protein
VTVCVVVCAVYNVKCCVWLLAFSGIPICLAVAVVVCVARPLAVSVTVSAVFRGVCYSGCGIGCCFLHYKREVYKGGVIWGGSGTWDGNGREV